MQILVTYGTTRGGTAGLAEAVAAGLADAGHDVDIRPAQEVDGLEQWDGVVVGGALYAWMWQREARRFVARHTHQLRELPVWAFSSGPLDDSASRGELEAPWTVRRLLERIDARGHVTFGGRLQDESASQLPQGDWRDMDQARDWGKEVGGEAAKLPMRTGSLPPVEGPAALSIRRLAVGLCLFTGVTGIIGGFEMMAWPRGGPIFGLPLSLLEGTPFSTFLGPGILLFVAVGLVNLSAGVLLHRRQEWSEVIGFTAGGALTVWIVVEMAMMQTTHWLQVLYMVVGVATLGATFWLWSRLYLPARRVPERTGR